MRIFSKIFNSLFFQYSYAALMGLLCAMSVVILLFGGIGEYFIIALLSFKEFIESVARIRFILTYRHFQNHIQKAQKEYYEELMNNKTGGQA